MYRDSYVVALMVDGKIQKESDDGIVLIPFGSEYVIRLKNKLRKRAIADVWLDGRIASQGIVIDANGTVDLERFVTEGNLSEGKKFKLARLTDPKVEQPNDSENGVVEVNFYPEKEVPVIEKTVIHDYTYHWPYNHFHNSWHCSLCCQQLNCYICHPYTWPYKNPDTIWCSTSTGGITSDGFSANVNQSFTANQNQLGDTKSSVNLNSLSNSGEAAATVEGGTSLQKFSSVSIDVDRSKPTTIRLIVKGISKLINVCSCGYKRKKSEKFCPNDGTQLVA
jgi:hypothetical protein